MTLSELIPLITEDCIVEIWFNRNNRLHTQLLYDGKANEIKRFLSQDIINYYPIESIDTSCYNPRGGEPGCLWRSYLIIDLNENE